MANETAAHPASEAGHAPDEGHAATTEAHGGGHAAPTALWLDPTGWVALSMAFFIGILLIKRVPGLIGKGLDTKIAEIREQLEEAKQLRAEAEALRAEYAKKIAGAEKDAAAMLDHADHEAKAIVAKAKTDAKDLVARRQKMAEDKIAAAERAAIDDIRAKAVDAATGAAASLIAKNHGAASDAKLVEKTILGLGRAN